MLSTLVNTYRLARAGIVLAWYGAPFIPREAVLPGPLRFLLPKLGEEAGPRDDSGGAERLSTALRVLGPSYVKLGQFLSTRPDVVGANVANALGFLRDRLPPFPTELAKAEVELAFGQPAGSIYAEFGPPVAAASIAQVHKAAVNSPSGRRFVAVKILRPGVEKRFIRDLDSFYFAARTIERFSRRSRRLRPVAAVDTLAQTVAIEMDLRLEAAAMSEMAENIERAGDKGFRIPKVDWTKTARRVLTSEWIDGIPLTNLAAIDAAGLDRGSLGLNVIRSFLRHAIRDGFFHADMHQGNLFVDPSDGSLVAVDFGIMGRLGLKERRFLAEMLHGFIGKNYRRVAEVHFEAGYVPPSQDVAAFAQALRAIAEPIADRRADEISMAKLLTQLFEITELFHMRMRPELLLLQKTMVVVEGVARSLDPKINMWVAAEPVVREWMTNELGPAARLRDMATDLSTLAAALRQAPKVIETGMKLADKLLPMAEEELTLEARFVRRVEGLRYFVIPVWIATAVLIAIAVKLWLF